MAVPFNYVDQRISRNSAPDLRRDSVLAVTPKKCLMRKLEMLLDPFEEQFNLPTAFIQGSNLIRFLQLFKQFIRTLVI